MNHCVTSVRQLLLDPPLVHGEEGAGELITHGLLPEALEFIETRLSPGARTLETGSGLSTITFAMGGAEHTCIVPNPPEAERILTYCTDRGIDTSTLAFEFSPSEVVLPTLDIGELDLVLIDGSHSFPQVFIDWFYTQRALKVGGLMVIDDVHVWTGRVLRDFLAAEPEWHLIEKWRERTVVFTKITPTNDDKIWFEQPYVWRRTRPATLGRARMAAAMIGSGEFREVAKRVRATFKGE